MSRREKDQLGWPHPVMNGGDATAPRPGPFLDHRHHAEASIRIGKHVHLGARADISTGGLLSIGVLVSGILLATAVLVDVAIQGSRSRRNRS